MRLETRESARTGGRQAHRGHGVRVRQHEDARAVVLSEHPVVRFEASPSRLRQLPHDSCPVGGLRNEPFHRLAGEAEQNQVLRHHYHPQVHGRRPDLAQAVSISPAVSRLQPTARPPDATGLDEAGHGKPATADHCPDHALPN